MCPVSFGAARCGTRFDLFVYAVCIVHLLPRIEAVCGAISRPGDIVVMARPSYFLAADIFRDWSLECVEIPSGDDQTGIDLDALEAALVGGLRPRFVYLGTAVCLWAAGC